MIKQGSVMDISNKAYDGFVVICCIPNCKKIKIDEERKLWLKQDENPELYAQLTEGKRISHGYCTEHYEEAMREIEEWKKENNLE